MSQAGVKVSIWASVLAEIMNDWRSPKVNDLGQALGGHLSYGWVVTRPKWGHNITYFRCS